MHTFSWSKTTGKKLLTFILKNVLIIYWTQIEEYSSAVLKYKVLKSAHLCYTYISPDILSTLCNYVGKNAHLVPSSWCLYTLI